MHKLLSRASDDLINRRWRDLIIFMLCFPYLAPNGATVWAINNFVPLEQKVTIFYKQKACPPPEGSAVSGAI